MSDIFSEEMKKEIIKLFDKQYKVNGIADILDQHRDVYIGIEKAMKELNSEIEDCKDEINDFDRRLDEVPAIEPIKTRFEECEEELKVCVKEDELKDMVGQTMLALMPNFKLLISKEIKKHLVTIAEYVIRNFKEKD
jgi:chromosome segregation ATPase